jgi:type I restriction enzyme S subunit
LEKFRQSVLGAAFRGDLTAEWRAQNPDVEPASTLIERTPLPGGTETGRAATKASRPGKFAVCIGDPVSEAPSGWHWVALSRIAKMESGHTPSRGKPEYWGGTIPWLSIPDAREHHGRVINSTLQYVTEEGLANSSARLLPTGTVCLSRTASVGYVTIMGVDMATSQDFADWVCSPAMIPEYLMYALMAEGDDIRRFGEGSTHTTIYFPELKALYICLAPLKEQAEIVRLVSKGLERIKGVAHLVDEALGRLGPLEQSILAKAFRGELVPQDPDDEPASVLLERIRAERAAQAPVKRGRKKQVPGLLTPTSLPLSGRGEKGASLPSGGDEADVASGLQPAKKRGRPRKTETFDPTDLPEITDLSIDEISRQLAEVERQRAMLEEALRGQNHP